MKKLPSSLRQKLNKFIDNPAFERKFHAYWTVIWGLLIPISALTGLKNSIGWVVLMSAWANFAGHFSAWAASKSEANLTDLINQLLKKHDR